MGRMSLAREWSSISEGVKLPYSSPPPSSSTCCLHAASLALKWMLLGANFIASSKTSMARVRLPDLQFHSALVLRIPDMISSYSGMPG